jgi:hypothetical protein
MASAYWGLRALASLSMARSAFKYHGAQRIQVPLGQGLGSLALSLSIANTLFIYSANTEGALLWSTASRPGAGLFFTLLFNRLYLKLARMRFKPS